jgi:hypothetical protein
MDDGERVAMAMMASDWMASRWQMVSEWRDGGERMASKRLPGNP